MLVDILHTNEVTDFLKPAGISVAFIHQHLRNNANPCVYSMTLLDAHVKAHLHNHEN